MLYLYQEHGIIILVMIEALQYTLKLQVYKLCPHWGLKYRSRTYSEVFAAAMI